MDTKIDHTVLDVHSVHNFIFLQRSRPLVVNALNDERYKLVFNHLKGEGLKWCEGKTSEERCAYRAFKNDLYVLGHRFNPLSNQVEERILDRVSLRIIPKTSEIKKIIKMYKSAAPQGGARAVSKAVSKHFTGIGEKVVRRYRSGKNSS
jgi:hypothetical protein